MWQKTYLHNIPMKGKTTLLGVKITLWNATSVEVWYMELSFSTSLRTLLFASTFSTLQRALEGFKTYVVSTIDNYTPGWNHFLRSLLLRTGCWHFGKRGLSWICLTCMWFTTDVHLATFSGPEDEDVAADSTLPLLDHLAVLLFSHFTQFLR